MLITQILGAAMGGILIAQKRWEEAANEYKEGLRLKGTDENAVKQLYKIYKEIEMKIDKEAE